MIMGAIAKRNQVFSFAIAAALFVGSIAAAATRPQRIVSTNVCADQLVMLLAEPSDIVSVSRLAREPEISNFAGQARAYPINNARAEEIVQLKPDLLMGDIQTGKQANRLAKSIGVPVHIIDWPASIADVRMIILSAGSVLGQESKATSIVSGMDRRIEHAGTRAGIRITALVYEPNGMTTGPGTLTDDILTVSGLKNLAAALTGASYGVVPLERVIVAAPGLLILDDSYRQTSSRAQGLLQHPAFRALKGKTAIFRVPSRLWLCPGPWVAEAVERLAAQRHRMDPLLAPR